MRHLLLGRRTGLRVSAVALGTGRLGTTRDGAPDADEAAATLGAFLDRGGSFIDTSSAYQGGCAEEIVGDVLSGRARDEVVISSKYGRTPSKSPAAASAGAHRKAMAAEVEGSLRRLKTDRIDLYFPHFDDGATPMEEILRGLDDLTRQGKILYVGLSNFPAWRAAAAVAMADLLRLASLATLQLQYSLAERAADRELLPLVQATGLGAMAWSPTAGGKLVDPDPGRIGETLAGALTEVAAAHDAQALTVAIAWVASRGLVPIIGPRDRGQLQANLAAADLTLSPAQQARLSDASAITLGYPYDLLEEQRSSMAGENTREVW